MNAAELFDAVRAAYEDVQAKADARQSAAVEAQKRKDSAEAVYRKICADADAILNEAKTAHEAAFAQLTALQEQLKPYTAALMPASNPRVRQSA